MFNAPKIFTNIPDISMIYEINDMQEKQLDESVQELEKNIFLSDMGESMIQRWEKMLKIAPFDDDTLEDRRFRIKTKVLEKLPYSYRVIIRKLNTLCPGGYSFYIDDNRIFVEVKLMLKSKKMITDVQELMDSILPLNMMYKVSIIFNKYSNLSELTHDGLGRFTHSELRNEILRRGGYR